MSETPVFPIPGKKTEQEPYITERSDYASQAEQALAAWETGFDTAERFDLRRDETINPQLWSEKTANVTQAPEYAAPKTRADIIAESLEHLDDHELRAQLDAHTKAIVHGLRRQYGLIA